MSRGDDHGCLKARRLLGHEIKCLNGCPFDPCLEMVGEQVFCRSKEYTERNINIIQSINQGVSADKLAEKYNLSVRSINRIVSSKGD
jgi:hypothetical protein